VLRLQEWWTPVRVACEVLLTTPTELEDTYGTCAPACNKLRDGQLGSLPLGWMFHCSPSLAVTLPVALGLHPRSISADEAETLEYHKLLTPLGADSRTLMLCNTSPQP